MVDKLSIVDLIFNEKVVQADRVSYQMIENHICKGGSADKLQLLYQNLVNNK